MRSGRGGCKGVVNAQPIHVLGGDRLARGLGQPAGGPGPGFVQTAGNAADAAGGAGWWQHAVAGPGQGKAPVLAPGPPAAGPCRAGVGPGAGTEVVDPQRPATRGGMDAARQGLGKGAITILAGRQGLDAEDAKASAIVHAGDEQELLEDPGAGIALEGQQGEIAASDVHHALETGAAIPARGGDAASRRAGAGGAEFEGLALVGRGQDSGDHRNGSQARHQLEAPGRRRGRRARHRGQCRGEESPPGQSMGAGFAGHLEFEHGHSRAARSRHGRQRRGDSPALRAAEGGWPPTAGMGRLRPRRRGGGRAMRISETSLPGVMQVVGEPVVDERGSFARTWCRDSFAAAGIVFQPSQASLSDNRQRHTLRGLHWQAAPAAEQKLVRCL
ncbi:MAG: hypothetical protein EON47_09610, partial [Acetobacteraceae bacterium]